MPQRSASEKLAAPTGMTMNSWKSTLLSAWAPPLSTFIIGTGSTWALAPPTWRHSGSWSSSAPAWATARDAPRMALAPRRDLLSVPSRSMRAKSTPRWSSASRPSSAWAISPLTLATAVVTPLPPKRSPPSRSSAASNWPVEAPLGTAARPKAPESSPTSTSTVGLPRESRISRPATWVMVLTMLLAAPKVPRTLPGRPRRLGDRRVSPRGRRPGPGGGRRPDGAPPRGRHRRRGPRRRRP